MITVSRRSFVNMLASSATLPMLVPPAALARTAGAPAQTPKPISASLFRNAAILAAPQITMKKGILYTGRPTVIWADILEFPSDARYATNGAPLMIVTRKLIATAGAILSTQGPDGTPNFEATSRPTPSTIAGHEGTPGAAGGNGKPGAAIFLVADQIIGRLILNASGGNGGRGQSGGEGGIGPTGAAASGCGQSTGGPPRPPGPGGPKGPGGRGGKAGQVWVQLGKYVNPDHIAIIATSGLNGLDGAPGKVGPTGSRGPGSGPCPPPFDPCRQAPATCMQRY